MLQCEVLQEKGVVILTPNVSGKGTDFEKAAKAVDACIARKGKLAGIMIRTEGYSDWQDFADLMEELRFIQRRGVPIDRLAGVSQGSLEKHLPALANAFHAREYRHFAYGDKARALAWLEAEA
jgi:hypothetical protein